MLNELLLLSGNDIPFQEARMQVHPPTIKEIGYIGEEAFFMGCDLLNFSKDVLSPEDKSLLEDKSNFEIFMSIMKDNTNVAIQKNKISALMVLSLLFPDYQISLGENIMFSRENDEEKYFIDKNNFEVFKQILVGIFCLNRNKKEDFNYNPAGERARKIAEKLRKGREKVAAAKAERQKIAVFSRYISILSVGEKKSINELLQLTVYQLFDEFERFELKQAYDAYFKAKLAGAKDIDEVDNWMKDIHP